MRLGHPGRTRGRGLQTGVRPSKAFYCLGVSAGADDYVVRRKSGFDMVGLRCALVIYIVIYGGCELLGSC